MFSKIFSKICRKIVQTGTEQKSNIITKVTNGSGDNEKIFLDFISKNPNKIKTLLR